MADDDLLKSGAAVEDVIIIGGGPAAHAAALYTATKKPLMFEGNLIGSIGPGGQLTTTTDVDNYPGFPEGVQGPELMRIMLEQTKSKGVRVVRETVTGMEHLEERGLFRVFTKKSEHITRSVIVATGASAKRLDVPGTGKDEYWQKGISACAVCDGFFFRGKVVAVIGGGDSAMEDALYMRNIVKKVFLIHRREEFRARKDKLLKVKNAENIEIITPAELVSAEGDGERLTMLKLKKKDTGDLVDLSVDGLFFAIGHVPNVAFLNGILELRENGYVKADDRGRTSLSGVFACGDVQDYFYRQAVTAASNGCVAGKECIKYLEELQQ